MLLLNQLASVETCTVIDQDFNFPDLKFHNLNASHLQQGHQSDLDQNEINYTATCMLRHVVLQLSCPLAFVATFWTKIFLLFLMDPHMKL